MNQYKCSQYERTIKHSLYDLKGLSESHQDISKTGSGKWPMSQNRSSQYNNTKGTLNRRDRSAVNTRNAVKKLGKNSNYADTDFSKGNKSSNRRLPSMRRGKDAANASVVIDKKSKIDVEKPGPDISVGNIKLGNKNESRLSKQSKRKSDMANKDEERSDGEDYDDKAKSDKENKPKEKKEKKPKKAQESDDEPEPKQKKRRGSDSEQDKRSKHENSETEKPKRKKKHKQEEDDDEDDVRESKELGQLKGLKVGKKKTIETSVKLS